MADTRPLLTPTEIARVDAHYLARLSALPPMGGTPPYASQHERNMLEDDWERYAGAVALARSQTNRAFLGQVYARAFPGSSIDEVPPTWFDPRGQPNERVYGDTREDFLASQTRSSAGPGLQLVVEVTPVEARYRWDSGRRLAFSYGVGLAAVDLDDLRWQWRFEPGHAYQFDGIWTELLEPIAQTHFYRPVPSAPAR
jgi:hypothetical protein